MKLTTALGLSIFCLATVVWAETKVAPTQATPKSAAASASASPVKRPEPQKFEAIPAAKVSSIVELRKLQSSLKKVELNLPAPTTQPAATPAQNPTAPTTSSYQTGSGVSLTVNSLTDAASHSFLQLNNVYVTSTSMTGPTRWLVLKTCFPTSIPAAEAVFGDLPSGRHTYMATVMFDTNTAVADPVYIEVAGTKFGPNAFTRNGNTVRILFTYTTGAENWIRVTAGWTAPGAGSMTFSFQYIQLAAID